jgi:hypothetical protein
MPFSSDGDTIDFIYGVINWKTVDGAASVAPAAPVEEAPVEAAPEVSEIEVPVIEPEAESETEYAPLGIDDDLPVDVIHAEPAEHLTWEDGPLSDSAEEAAEVPGIEIGEDAGLADRLWAARETAEAVKTADGRSRAALYRALALAYDFALAAEANPADYAELLEDSGVKAQARAPMTPIVKLVFGIDYDKARLTEFAAALSYARRQDIPAGGFQPLIEQQPGGLKALVAAERAARRPEPRPDTKGDAARAKLRSAPPISLAEVPAAEEFAVIVTRRGADGRHEPVAIVEDEALIDRAIRRAV